MIIVVEGVSAAGKTSWCDRYGSMAVAELPPTDPPEGDPTSVARFWTDAHCLRWREAEERERIIGSAYCDTDPLKLHYPWCLWQLGFSHRQMWTTAVTEMRTAIDHKKIGFADKVVFLEPDPAVVRRNHANDASRQRRNFERHLQIGPALRTWYEFIERLSPNRVIWHGELITALPLVSPKADRFSLELFDSLVALADSHAK